VLDSGGPRRGMMESILIPGLFIAAVMNIVFAIAAIATRNVEAQAFSAFVAVVLIIFSVIYSKPALAVLGIIAIAFLLAYYMFAGSSSDVDF